MDQSTLNVKFPNGTVSQLSTDNVADTGTTCDLLLEEPTHEEEILTSRGESLWRVLPEIQINMIAFSGTIGNGLFLGSGNILALAGPGGAVMSYLLMATVISAVVSCLGEMTALMPVNAPVMEFPRRFLDRGVGFAVGWTYWFAYAITATHNTVSAAKSVKFHWEDKKTLIVWKTGEHVNPAVWITLFLVCVTIINLFPVKYFGILEWVVGSIKLIFIILLILMMVILNLMKPRSNAYYTHSPGTKYWNDPYSFINPVYHVRSRDGSVQREITGGAGKLLGVWSACINAIYSYVAVDIFAATAAESKSLADSECMKMAARKITLRAVVLYTLAMVSSSFLVPTNHPFINVKTGSIGTQSPFLIAVMEAGLPIAAQFFNAMFLFSSFTCAINSVYVSSRVLHTLALRDQAGPDFINKRLRRCHVGVPVRAVLATALLMLIGYLGHAGESSERLSELSANCTVSYLIVYTIICATYLRFYQTLQEANDFGNSAETQNGVYNRNHPRYPYKSHGQWFKACYGMISCFILLIFNGVSAFLKDPFDTREFVVSYISLPVFGVLFIGYKLRKHGFNLLSWRAERSNDLRNCVQVTSSARRKGRLEFPDHGPTSRNWMAFFEWVWAWTK
ncbi:hypothetical protein FQN57_006317 [Myotisia sp. PD_48]|nr:hypothetical protein FQN57_006317 [Myotisia sp. PD_48]